MIKKITCIQCPQGCQLEITKENGYVLKVVGNKCPKGEAYGRQEIENPVRILTSTILAEGLEVPMIPVKTDGPIPKSKLLEAMEFIKKIKITHPVKPGTILIGNLLNLEVNLVATREVN